MEGDGGRHGDVVFRVWLAMVVEGAGVGGTSQARRSFEDKSS